MVTVANPIYDIVFKYLMEDERIARTILSALLKKDILRVEVRPHEYANDQRDTLSVFRIDFGATVRKEDGSEHLILIELQKTWLETETLRFRQYLGVQYQNPKNIVEDSRDRHALPMVAVYLLGHKVGDIEEPVLYVEHDFYDYNGRVVTKGLPNAFVDSLTHNSIIVQIPRLHGQVNTRLDKVLSIFDQTRKDELNQQVLNLDDALYADDSEMQRIVHRLLMAASNADVRMDMNVEDEYYSVIEKRDTEILMRRREIAEQKVQIDEQKAKIAYQKTQLVNQKTQLDNQKVLLDNQKAQLDNQKAQLDNQKVQLSEQSERLQQKDQQLRTSVQLLQKAGLTLQAIARSLNMTEEEVSRLI